MMPATIERRVVALETSAGAGDKCPECGFGPYEKTPWKVHHVRTGEGEPDRWCETCGRKLVHNIKLGWGHGSL